MLPGLLAGESGRAQYDRAIALLDQFGVAELAKRVPAEMSGGEQQRVAIARALFRTPDVVLADEPTGNLDTENGRKVIEALESLNSSGQTIVLVTHDQSIAGDAPRLISLLDGRVESDSGPTQPKLSHRGNGAVALSRDAERCADHQSPRHPSTHASGIAGRAVARGRRGRRRRRADRIHQRQHGCRRRRLPNCRSRPAAHRRRRDPGRRRSGSHRHRPPGARRGGDGTGHSRSDPAAQRWPRHVRAGTGNRLFSAVDHRPEGMPTRPARTPDDGDVDNSRCNIGPDGDTGDRRRGSVDSCAATDLAAGHRQQRTRDRVAAEHRQGAVRPSRQCRHRLPASGRWRQPIGGQGAPRRPTGPRLTGTDPRGSRPWVRRQHRAPAPAGDLRPRRGRGWRHPDRSDHAHVGRRTSPRNRDRSCPRRIAADCRQRLSVRGRPARSTRIRHRHRARHRHRTAGGGCRQ